MASNAMTDHERADFRQYLRQCTDQQVMGVWRKEYAAGRYDYANLACDEAYRRDLHWGSEMWGEHNRHGK